MNTKEKLQKAAEAVKALTARYDSFKNLDIPDDLIGVLLVRSPDWKGFESIQDLFRDAVRASDKLRKDSDPVEQAIRAESRAQRAPQGAFSGLIQAYVAKHPGQTIAMAAGQLCKENPQFTYRQFYSNCYNCATTGRVVRRDGKLYPVVTVKTAVRKVA